jgi:hypothetical protein
MGEIEVVRPVNDACITLHGHGKPQTVVVFGPDGERGRAEFTEHRQGATVALGDLKLGDILTFCSSEAFRPSWSGSDDTRLLSFYAEVVE